MISVANIALRSAAGILPPTSAVVARWLPRHHRRLAAVRLPVEPTQRSKRQVTHRQPASLIQGSWPPRHSASRQHVAAPDHRMASSGCEAAYLPVFPLAADATP